MKFTFLGQNCFLFDYNGKKILTDPLYNIQKDRSGFDIDKEKIDYTLITHAHGDHVQDVEEVVKLNPEVTLIGTPEICGHYPNVKSIDYNLGGTINLSGLQITMVHAEHTSSFPDGSYGGVPVGYLLRFDGKIIYLAGDTGVFSDMKLFRKLFGKINLAILPVGGHYTMDASQAAFAAKKFLKAKRVIGCHFDTFPPISIDHKTAERQFAEKEINFILPELGQQFEL